MTHLKTYTLKATLLVAFFILGHLMDGPPDWQAEEDTALAVSDLAKMEGAK